MKSIRKNHAKMMDELIVLRDDNGCLKLNEAEGSYMAFNMETCREINFDRIFSIAHYYVENGDAIADPYVELLRHEKTGHY